MTGESTPRRAVDFAGTAVKPAIPSRSPSPPVLDNRYRLDALLGSGGMGDVWRAVDLLLHQPVAVKQVRIPPEVDAEAARLLCERTLREARAAARLRSHPSIVTVHDVVIENGRPWIVMELVDGQSLDRIIATRGPLPVRMVATIGLALVNGLSAAHAGSVLHRDVKPANVLVCDDSRVVLTDFGIATMAGDTVLTRTDMVNGSPGYVAPERLNGEPGQPASDLWSLGATLYYAVEGRPPYQRDELLAVLVATINTDPDPMRLAGPLAPLLTGLLHRDPRWRMTAVQAREFLHALSVGDPTPATRSRRGRRRWVAGVAAAIAVLLGAAVIAAVLHLQKHDASPPLGALAVDGTAAVSSPATATDSSPAAPVAGADFLTPDGVRSVITALRPMMSGTAVRELDVFSDHASAEAPTAADPTLWDTITLINGSLTRSPGGTMDTDSATVDLSVFNWNALPTLLARAQRSLNVPHPTYRYIIVGPDLFDQTPSIRVYLADAYGGGYLEADNHGVIQKTYPRGK